MKFGLYDIIFFLILFNVLNVLLFGIFVFIII